MEIFAGILGILMVMALLAGVGIAALAALAIMVVLHFLTEMSFKKVFLISAGLGLLAPIVLGLGIAGSIADGSLERELRTELGDVVQLPQDGGEDWRQALADLRELSQENERGNLSDAEVEQRVERILGGLEDMDISIDINGDGVTISSDGDTGVPLELSEGVEAEQ